MRHVYFKTIFSFKKHLFLNSSFIICFCFLFHFIYFFYYGVVLFWFWHFNLILDCNMLRFITLYFNNVFSLYMYFHSYWYLYLKLSISILPSIRNMINVNKWQQNSERQVEFSMLKECHIYCVHNTYTTCTC